MYACTASSSSISHLPSQPFNGLSMVSYAVSIYRTGDRDTEFPAVTVGVLFALQICVCAYTIVRLETTSIKESYLLYLGRFKALKLFADVLLLASCVLVLSVMIEDGATTYASLVLMICILGSCVLRIINVMSSSVPSLLNNDSDELMQRMIMDDNPHEAPFVVSKGNKSEGGYILESLINNTESNIYDAHISAKPNTIPESIDDEIHVDVFDGTMVQIE